MAQTRLSTSSLVFTDHPINQLTRYETTERHGIMANEVATQRPTSLKTLDLSRVPDALGAVINVQAWAESIVIGTPYAEPNPDFISQMLSFTTITAETVEEAFAAAKVGQLQKMIADVPDASLGNIEITDLYVASSDFETGNPTYVIVTFVHLEDGYTGKFTTGATNVQATILALLRLGMWPIRCKIKRGTTKDKGGRYLLFVLPAD